MMVSKVLRTLEDKGFISRQEHPTDTRAKIITLTDSGAAVLQEALKVVEEADIAFFSLSEAALTGFNQTMVSLINQNKNA
jgi:DNA-binding MarR family transcriptional regulator